MPRPSRAAAGVIAVGLTITACGSDAARTPTATVTSTVSSTAAATVTSTAAPADESTANTPAPPPTSSAAGSGAPESAPASTTSEPTTPSTSTTTASSCRRLTDFDDPGGWAVVNDGVMGGRSDGRIEIADSQMRFTGEVVTQGGGFTSVRQILDGDELDGTDRIVMRVRADARTYGVTMEDVAGSGRRPVSHRADLTIDPSADDDGWSIVTMPYALLEPRIFGQPIDADAFDPDTATEIGIIIADGRDGGFELTVDWIDACR